VKVLNVLYDERVGGPQLRVLQVARRLRPRGFETIVAIPKGDPRFTSMLQDAKIPYRGFELVRLRDTRNLAVHARYVARFWPNVQTLRRLIREYSVDVVHTNGLMNSQAAIAARLEKVRLIWHLNDVGTPWLLRLGLGPLLRTWPDRIAIASRAVGGYYFPGHSPVNGRLHLLYAPVDPERFSPQTDCSSVRAEFGIPVIIGRLFCDEPRSWAWRRM